MPGEFDPNLDPPKQQFIVGQPRVLGYCPMGCGETLRLDEPHVYCTNPECQEPMAVTLLLADRETEHLIQVNELGWLIRHPLAERIEERLLECALNVWMQGFKTPPVSEGLYRVRRDPEHPSGWKFYNTEH